MDAARYAGQALRGLRDGKGWTLKRDERAERNPGVDPVQGRARPADADLRQAAPAEPAARHAHVRAVRRSRATRPRRRSPRGAASARSTMPSAVQTPNYDYYYLCTELRRKRMIPASPRSAPSSSRSSASWSIIRRGIHLRARRDGSTSTPNSTIRSRWSRASRSTSIRTWATPMSPAELRRGGGAGGDVERRRRPDGVADDPARRALTIVLKTGHRFSANNDAKTNN